MFKELFGAAKNGWDWYFLKKKHLKMQPACIVCGNTVKKELNVHHLLPKSIYPEYELCEWNLATVCEMPCHFLLAHLGNWEYWNPNFLEDAACWRDKILHRLNDRLPDYDYCI